MSESSKKTKDIDAVDADGWTALHLAAKKGDVSEVERLLAAGANVDARTTRRFLGVGRNSTPLIVATRFNQFDIMRLLVDHGADIEARDDRGYVNENTLCVFNNAARRGTPLFAAPYDSPLKNIDFLIWKGANVNSISTEGYEQPIAVVFDSPFAEIRFCMMHCDGAEPQRFAKRWLLAGAISMRPIDSAKPR